MKKGVLQTAKKMKQAGMKNIDIANMIGLSIEEIDSL